jgi:hypothetical protein
MRPACSHYFVLQTKPYKMETDLLALSGEGIIEHRQTSVADSFAFRKVAIILLVVLYG